MIISIMIMRIIMFVGRKQEMEDLRVRLTSDGFEFIVVYGRRRVGKTRLVLESVKDMDHIYYLATTKDNLKEFRKEVSESVLGISHSAEDWISTFRLLKNKIIILDEFPYMIKEDPSLTSTFQKMIDKELSNTGTKLIILGSSITMMTDKVLNYSSPLYGRRTGTLDLGPLRFSDLIEYYPNSDIEDLCRSFGISDGIPYYMEKVQPPIWSWLEREIRKTDTFLKEEVDFLLKYEFTDIGNYKKILDAIAHGKNRPSEIRDHCGMKHSDIMPYLRNLMNVRLVKRELPIGANERSKKGRYSLSDNLLAFWFRFIRPNRSAIEERIFDPSSIKEDFNRYMGHIFERIAREIVIDMMKGGKLPIKFNSIGKWWHRDEEIDIVCLNEKEKKAMLFEVKWKELKEKDCDYLIKGLERKSELIPVKGYEFHYGLIAKRSERKEGLIFDLSDYIEMKSV